MSFIHEKLFANGNFNNHFFNEVAHNDYTGVYPSDPITGHNNILGSFYLTDYGEMRKLQNFLDQETFEYRLKEKSFSLFIIMLLSLYDEFRNATLVPFLEGSGLDEQTRNSLMQIFNGFHPIELLGFGDADLVFGTDGGSNSVALLKNLRSGDSYEIE